MNPEKRAGVNRRDVFSAAGLQAAVASPMSICGSMCGRLSTRRRR